MPELPTDDPDHLYEGKTDIILAGLFSAFLEKSSKLPTREDVHACLKSAGLSGDNLEAATAKTMQIYEARDLIVATFGVPLQESKRAMFYQYVLIYILDCHYTPGGFDAHQTTTFVTGASNPDARSPR